MRFTISKASNDQFFFEVQAAGNYETLARSETYKEKADAQHAIELIRQGAASAQVVDKT